MPTFEEKLHESKILYQNTLYQLVAKKLLKKCVRDKHVSEIVRLSLEYMDKKIEEEGSIKIHGFGEFWVKESGIRSFFNKKTKMIEKTLFKPRFKFKIAENLKKILSKNINTEETNKQIQIQTEDFEKNNINYRKKK